MAIVVTHSKTLIAPDSGAEDKVYGSDYVDPASHTVALGADDNFVTDAQLVVIGNTSGTNTGDASGHSTLVVGPASATDGAVAKFDGTTGKLLKDGVVLGTIATQAASAVAITGGTINGTPIGGTTKAAIEGTTLSTTGLVTSLMSGQTTPVTLGQWSDYTPYGAISFNGVHTFAGFQGVAGGGAGTVLVLGVPTAHTISFRVNNVQIVNIASGICTFGNGLTAGPILGTSLGIGTSAPDKILEVNLGTTNAFRLTYNDANGSAATYMDTTLSSAGVTTFTGAGSAPAVNFSHGVEIASTLKVRALSTLVDGADGTNTSGYKFVSFMSNSAEAGNVVRVAQTSAVVFTTSSDARLKNVSGPSDPTAAANRIMAYRMRDFEWKSQPGMVFSGPIAQEIYEVNKDPMLVFPGEGESSWSVNMSGFISDLIMTAQRNDARIAELEARLEDLVTDRRK